MTRRKYKERKDHTGYWPEKERGCLIVFVGLIGGGAVLFCMAVELLRWVVA
jgi:hypothetical protein